MLDPAFLKIAFEIQALFMLRLTCFKLSLRDSLFLCSGDFSSAPRSERRFVSSENLAHSASEM